MSKVVDVLARLLARRQGRAFPIREAFSLAADPPSVFAVAPIKMVSEEIVQAIAFGDPARAPTIVTRWHPLGRDAGELEVFGKALDRYLTRTLAAGRLPRIWLPHRSALTLLEILSHRYRTNQKATEGLRRMGWQCRVLIDEASYPGQQMVAVATDLLRSHVNTGQAPIKDGHLGALLAWVEPVPGRDSAEEADRRALVPASGVLERRADDRVEAFRKIAKGQGSRAAKARLNIEELLRQGALAEWERLAEARRAFWRLDLGPGLGAEPLVNASKDRITYALEQPRNPAALPHSLARLLERHEYAMDLVEEADLRGDTRMRERARRKGRAITAEVVSIRQPRKNCKPCEITIRTDQEVLRVRKGIDLQTVEGNVIGRIIDVSEDKSGATLLTMMLKKGVRKADLPTLQSNREWIDIVPRDLSFVLNKVYAQVKGIRSPLVYDRGVSGSTATGRRRADLLAIARQLRRR